MTGGDTRRRVVIVGGGPAGAACARALARKGVEGVCLIDDGGPADMRIGECVPPDIRRPLHELGLLEAFLNERHEPCLGSCSSWGDVRIGYNDFLLNPLGHGWHLDRCRFDEFLLARAEAAGTEVWHSHRCIAAAGDEHGLCLNVQRPDGLLVRVNAEVVVDASGLAAAVGRRCGARHAFDDRLIALCAVLDMADAAPMSRLTHLEATEYGWWYSARVPGERIVVSLTSDARVVRELRLNEPDEWQKRLCATRHVARLPSASSFSGRRLHRVPCPSVRLDPPAGPRWLAVGDAAMVFDPLLATGIQKALINALTAADVVDARLGGDTHIMDHYRDDLDRRWREYLDMRHSLYGLETRWPQEPFWANRGRGAVRTDILP